MNSTAEPAAATPAAAASPAKPAAARCRVSVVVPSYNEEENVPLMAAAIHASLAGGGISDYEIVFVDDGSKDGTAAAARQEIAKDRRVRLLSFKKNSGQTAALEAGIKNARGDAIVTLDGDLQNDPSDIPLLLSKLDEFDCVCGYRAKRHEGDSFVRVASSKIANWVRTRIARDSVRDAGCCFRAFKREIVRNVKLFRGMHRFLPTLIRMEGGTVGEVPVKHNPRRFGKSKYGILNRVFAASYDLFAVRWMQSHRIRWEIGDEA